MKYTKEQVMAFLPHRDPFLFIDSVEQVILPEGIEASDLVKNNFKNLVGGKIIAHCEVKPEWEIFKGHFPDFPILPGVVQVEMMGQASAFLSAECLHGDFENVSVTVALLAVEKAKFRKKVQPPMNIRIESRLKAVRGFMQTYEAKCFEGDTLLSEVTFMASLKYE